MKNHLLPAILVVISMAVPLETLMARPGGGGGGRGGGGGGARMGGGGGGARMGGGGRSGGFSGGGARMSAPRMSSGPRISSGGGSRMGGSAPRMSGGPRISSGAPRISSGAPRSSGGAPRMSGPPAGSGQRVGSGSPRAGGPPRLSGGNVPRVSGGNAPAGGQGSTRIGGPVIADRASPRSAVNDAAVDRTLGAPRTSRPAGGNARTDSKAGKSIAGAQGTIPSDQARTISPRGNIDRAGANRGTKTGEQVNAAGRGGLADRGNSAMDRQAGRTTVNRPPVDRVNDFLGMRGRGEGAAERAGSVANRARGNIDGTIDRPSWSRDARASQTTRVSERLAQANVSPVRASASTRNWLASNPDRARHWNDWAGGVNRRGYHHGQNYNGHHDGHHHHHHHGFFTPGWWAVNSVFFPWRHNYYWWGARPWSYWWGSPTWGGICNWYGGWGWSNPCYYDYGYGGNVVYVDRYVYVNGNPVATAENYALSAADLAATPPSPGIADSPGEWLALGTFVIATSKNEVDPPRVIQLATDKEGNVSGTMVNKATNKTYPVQGRVDKETQRVAFTIGDNKDTVLETGIYNLTQNETPVLVHQGTDRTETYVLIRLEEPKEEEKVDGARVESLLP